MIKTSRRSFLKTIGIGTAAAAGAMLTSRLAAEPVGKKHPNILVIMADDLGYGDLSCYGAKAFKTPNIDALATGGLKFTNGYCSASTCTPTRFSFLTGKYAFRQRGTGIAPPNATALIQPGTETIASMLKKAGYATGVVGKWHLGLGSKPGPDWNGLLKPGPLEIGFDYCYLLPTTNDRVPSVYVENHKVVNLDPKDPLWVGRKKPADDHPTGVTERKKLKMDWSHGHNNTVHNGIGRIGYFTGGTKARWRDEDLADQWVAKSVQWIEKHKDGPFFLFFSSHDIHVPRMPHERFHGKTPLGFRGDAIVQLDWCVGELTKTLKRLKLDKDTLIVFCSDNGPVLDDGYKDGAVTKLGDHKPAGICRGGKYSTWEGGTRTPFITYWPGKIAPGISEKFVSTIDLAGSFSALAGQKPTGDALPDSINVIDALLGKKGAAGRDHIVEQGGGLALRVGDWKLLKGRKPRKRKGKPAPKTSGQYQLYNLKTDPSETKNVIAQNPEIAEKLTKRLTEITQAKKTRP
jgi:arylsulfatase A-like enzyme